MSWLVLLIFSMRPIQAGAGDESIQVGDGKPFSSIERAIAAARPGALVEVFPKAAGYHRVALLLSKRVTLRATAPTTLDGRGFDYSGIGSVPRAMIQVEPGASGTVIDGFTITGASNKDGNASGVRIRGANDVTVFHCEIHGNDMGIMSDGEHGTRWSATNQNVQDCDIHENGSLKNAGYNHNLYLSGDSVTIDRCLVWGALTGHNLKSRAHWTRVTNSVLYGGANRQIDCVEGDFTMADNSNLLVYNCILAMDPNSKGNGNMIHFGAEKGHRHGLAQVMLCTLYTEFLSPILVVDAAGCSGQIDDCIAIDPDPIHPFLAGVAGPGSGSRISGGGDWLSEGYSLEGSSIPADQVKFGTVKPATAAIPRLGSAGFALEGVRPTPVRLQFRNGTGRLQDQPVPAWKIGAFPRLYTVLKHSFAFETSR